MQSFLNKIACLDLVLRKVWQSLIAGLCLLLPYIGNALDEQSELLSSADAFEFSANTTDSGVNIRWKIADGYYMYRDRFSYSLHTADNESVAIKPQFPKGIIKQDPSFGKVEVYTQEANFLIPLEPAAQLKTATLTAQGQGCNAPVGVCYPPIRHTISLASLPNLANDSAAPPIQAQPALYEVEKALPNSAASPSKARSGLSIWVILSAFVAGVGLTFTPCVLPMIPILSSIIVGQRENLNRVQVARLTIAYIMGTAVTYAAMGAIAGATGDQLQAYFQNVWAIGAMSTIFLLMALSMFGLFQVQLPASFQSKLSSLSQNLEGGSLSIVFLLGLLSALIVGACVSPVLVSFLSVAVAKGSALLGSITMFAMALGMGVPLLILGLGAGQLLPKAGMWMDKVKTVFGVLLLAVAIYLLSALPAVPILFLWAALFIMVAVFMGATQMLPENASGWLKLQKGAGTFLLIWGALSLLGAMMGERDVMSPLPSGLLASENLPKASEITANLSKGSANSSTEFTRSAIQFTRVDSLSELNKQLARAREQSKAVLIDFYADWCSDCVRLDNTTFADEAVARQVNINFVAIKIDLTDPTSEQSRLFKKHYDVFGPPAVIFINANGKKLDKSFYGYLNPRQFLEKLES